MSSKLLVKLRFIGQRYDAHSLPFEVLKEFPYLEELLRKIARWLYLSENEERQRVPNGFLSNISFDLADIKTGSAIACVETVYKADQQILDNGEAHYLEKALSPLFNAIDSANNNADPTLSLPIDCLTYFNNFGSSLVEDDKIEFTSPQNGRSPVEFTRKSRESLVRASKKTVTTKKLSYIGVIPEADQAKSSFELQLINGKKIRMAYNKSQRDSIISAFDGYHKDSYVKIEGEGIFAADGKLESVDSIDKITHLAPLDVSVRLGELRLLKDGWYNGKGTVPQSDGFDWLENELISLEMDESELPHIYPTIEGNIQLEWTRKDTDISFEIDLETRIGELYSYNHKTKETVEKNIHIRYKEDWESVLVLIRN